MVDRRWGGWGRLSALLAAAGLLACGGSGPDAARAGALEDPQVLPLEADSNARREIQHVVVVMMENRSFDHFLGWVNGADGVQDLTFTDRAGMEHETHELAPDFQGCGHTDPDHSYAGSRSDYDGGAMDGWLRTDANDEYAIGYYSRGDLSFLGQAVGHWTTFDRYFSAMLGPTYPNRIYLYSAQTDRLDNVARLTTLPTIWDRLAEKGVSGRYYYNDLPVLALWGPKYLALAHPFSEFLADAASGNLPSVAFVDPRFGAEDQGLSNDDHPFSDIRDGEAFLNLVYSAVTQGPAWEHTVLVITFDEGGGFFDHVPPPLAPLPPADRLAGNDGRLGFRTPTLLVAPWARRGFVSHRRFDHTSILRMIEWRWGLRPLTVRDATANNLAEVLDLHRRPGRAPRFSVPPGPFGKPCPPPATAAAREGLVGGIRALAEQYGWPVYAPR